MSAGPTIAAMPIDRARSGGAGGTGGGSAGGSGGRGGRLNEPGRRRSGRTGRIRACVAPKRMRSPSTQVPFSESRSRTRWCSSISAWRGDTVGSSSTMSHSGARPTVTCRRGSGNERPDRSPPTMSRTYAVAGSDGGSVVVTEAPSYNSSASVGAVEASIEPEAAGHEVAGPGRRDGVDLELDTIENDVHTMKYYERTSTRAHSGVRRPGPA